MAVSVAWLPIIIINPHGAGPSSCSHYKSQASSADKCHHVFFRVSCCCAEGWPPTTSHGVSGPLSGQHMAVPIINARNDGLSAAEIWTWRLHFNHQGAQVMVTEQDLPKGQVLGVFFSGRRVLDELLLNWEVWGSKPAWSHHAVPSLTPYKTSYTDLVGPASIFTSQPTIGPCSSETLLH